MLFIQMVQKSQCVKKSGVIIITKFSGILLIRMNQINVRRYHLLQ